MSETGRLIYLRRTGRSILFFFVVPPIAALGAAWDDGDWQRGIAPAIVSLLVVAATLWIAIGWSGRTRLAEVRLDGDTLLLRRSHVLDRGKIWRVRLAETENWRAVLEHYDRHKLEAAAFDHAGVTYTLPVGGAQYADLEQLNAWIAEANAERARRAQ